MNKFQKIICVTISVLALSVVNAQANSTETKDLSLDKGTIDDQFEYVIRKSPNWQQYKTVKKVWLYALKSHTIDSLNAVKQNFIESQNEVKAQAEKISGLNLQLSNLEQKLNLTNKEKDSILLFGMQMSKSGYNSLLWSIIVALLLITLFFVYKFKNSNATTKEAKLKLSDLEGEYEDHRRKALEREQKVRRQLQDEINKNKS